jgi:hypothetical protein
MIPIRPTRLWHRLQPRTSLLYCVCYSGRRAWRTPRVCSSRVGLSATDLPPRSSPHPGVGTRIVLVHGAIGIRDNYISSVRPRRRVQTLLATRSCTRGVVCDTAALACSSPLEVAPLAEAHHHFSALDHSQADLQGYSAFREEHCPYCSLLCRRCRHKNARDLRDLATTPYSTSPADTRTTRRKIDHAALPLSPPPFIQDTRYGLCYAKPTIGAMSSEDIGREAVRCQV